MGRDLNIMCLDLGGTFLKVCVFNRKGEKITRTHLLEVGKERGEEEIINFMNKVINQMERKIKKTCHLISMGIPGLVNSEKGIVYSSPHFPEWKNFQFLERISSRFPEKFFIMDNDANLHALGEAMEGAGKGYKNFVMLTLGTGIGGGIILNGKLQRGGLGTGGEFGHMTVEPEGRQCNCGNRGCLERYASSEGIMMDVEEMGINASDPHEVMKKASEGNSFCLKIVKRFAYYLAIGIGNLVNAFSPEAVILGGGISQSMNVFKGFLKEELSRRGFKELFSRVKIIKAQLGKDAGIKGCYYNAINSFA